MIRFLKLSLFIVMSLGGVHLASADIKLTPHRISYDLKLKEASEKNGISSATGRMVFEFLGSACEGYTSSSRVVLNMQGQNGESIVNDQQTTSYESADEKNFRFVTQVKLNGQSKQYTVGSATKSANGVSLSLTKPESHVATFPSDVKFPNGFLKTIINAAINNEKFITQDIYDGGDGGKILYNTSTSIKNVQANDNIRDDLYKGKLNSLKRWRIQVGYFDNSNRGDPLPDYSFSAILYENGVTDEIMIDYGDMAFVGTAKTFEILSINDCK